MWKTGSILLSLCLGVAGTGASAPTHGAGTIALRSTPCGPKDGLEAICRPVGTEDLVDIVGTRWLIGSGLKGF